MIIKNQSKKIVIKINACIYGLFVRRTLVCVSIFRKTGPHVETELVTCDDHIHAGKAQTCAFCGRTQKHDGVQGDLKLWAGANERATNWLYLWARIQKQRTRLSTYLWQSLRV